MIMDYACSMGFHSYLGITENCYGDFNTPLQIAIKFVLNVVKVLSCWS